MGFSSDINTTINPIGNWTVTDGILNATLDSSSFAAALGGGAVSQSAGIYALALSILAAA